MLTQIVDHAIHKLGADGAFIRRYDNKTRTLKIVILNHHRTYKNILPEVEINEGVSGCVALKKRSVIISDKKVIAREFLSQNGIKSIIGIPIFIGNKFYGTFSLHSKIKGKFNRHDFKKFRDEILFISIFLYYLSLLENTSQEANRFKALQEMNRAMVSELTPGKLYEEIFDQVKKIIIPKNFRIDLYNEEKHQAKTVFCIERGKPRSIDYHPIINVSRCSIFKKVIKEKKIILTTEFRKLSQQRARKLPGDMKFASFVGLPLVVRNRCIGLMICWDAQRRQIFDGSVVKLLSLVAAQAAVAIYNAQLFDQLNKSINDLTLLYQIEYVISSILKLDNLLKTIVELIGRALENVITTILLTDEKRNCLVIKAISKGVEIDDRYTGIPMNRGIVGESIKAKRATYTPSVDNDPRYVPAIPGVKCELAIPLMIGTKVLGAIDFESRIENCFDRSTLDLLDDIAHRISVALENALLYEKLEKNYAATVRALVLAVEAKDAYTRGHSERVTDLAVRLTAALNLPEDMVRRVYGAGLLHDIGKIGVSEKVLNKPEVLNDFEFEEIKRHPIEGARMLQEIEQMSEIIPIIVHHHENFDGTGYPDRLKGHEISVEARILAVCDMFDAFTSARPYRRPFAKFQALNRLKSFKGTRLDPQIVDVFITIIGDNRG